MTIEDLPDELLVQILEYVPTAYKLNVVSKRFNDIVNDIQCRVFKNPNKYIEELSPPVYFLLYDNKYHKVIWDKAISKGHLDLIIELKKLNYIFNVNVSMGNAARRNHKNLVDFFIKKGARDWNQGMVDATIGGHKVLVDFFIVKGAYDWNRALVYAAGAGRKDLVDFYIEKGADDFSEALKYAEAGEHEVLVDFFIEQGASYSSWFD